MQRIIDAMPLRKQNKLAGSPLDENEEAESMEVLAHRMGLIAPNGPRKAQWDWFVLSLVFYTSVTVPFSLSFYAFTDLDASIFWFSIDILVDICFIVDVVRAVYVRSVRVCMLCMYALRVSSSALCVIGFPSRAHGPRTHLPPTSHPPCTPMHSHTHLAPTLYTHSSHWAHR